MCSIAIVVLASVICRSHCQGQHLNPHEAECTAFPSKELTGSERVMMQRKTNHTPDNVMMTDNVPKAVVNWWNASRGSAPTVGDSAASDSETQALAVGSTHEQAEKDVNGEGWFQRTDVNVTSSGFQRTDINLTSSGKCMQGFDPPAGTNCPDAKWVADMVIADPKPGKVIVDIGCNKGNDLIQWMEMWDMSPNQFWNTQKWLDFYAKKDIKYSACAPTLPNITARSVLKTRQAGIPTGVCVEPMPANVQVLREAASQFQYDSMTEFGKLHIVQAAVSDWDGPAEFPDGPAGGEETRVFIGSAPPVQMKTLDAIVRDLGLTHVDILTIDAEGADPAVLHGGYKVLESVRYLEFEVHRDFPNSAWSGTTLSTVVNTLSQKGFDCFWAGNNGRLVSVRGCWHDSFEKGMWSNVACVKRDDRWWPVLMSFAS